MLTVGDLKELYDCSLFEVESKSVMLQEFQHDNKDALECVTLKLSGEAIKIHPSFFDRQKGVFRVHSKFRNYRKICDGVLFYHRSDGKNFLIVVEMKSAFNDVKKACVQISSSYVKLKMHLENFRGYHAADYRELGLIFSFPPKEKDYVDSENNHMVLEAKMKFVGRIVTDPVESYLNQCKKELGSSGKTCLDAVSMTVDRLPLKASCIYTALPVLYQGVNDTLGTFSLDDILAIV